MFVSLAVCVLKLTVAQRGFNLWSLRLLHHSKLSPAFVARRTDEYTHAHVHVHIRIAARLQHVLSAAYLDIERLSAAAALLVVLACRDKPARGIVPDGPLPTSPIPAAAAVPPAPPRSQEAVIWMRSALPPVRSLLT
jgi:hypothetical protein